MRIDKLPKSKTHKLFNGEEVVITFLSVEPYNNEFKCKVVVEVPSTLPHCFGERETEDLKVNGTTRQIERVFIGYTQESTLSLAKRCISYSLRYLQYGIRKKVKKVGKNE